MRSDDMSDRMRTLQARVEANYQILASGLAMVRQEMHEGHAQQGETSGKLQEAMRELQESMAKLARQQEETARKVEASLDSVIEAVDRVHADLRDSLEVMAIQFDSVDDLRTRVASLEE